MEAYPAVVNQLVSRQINAEAQAALTYRTLASYFSHPSVSYPGFSRYFARQSQEEEGHAKAFADFHSLRGGWVCFGSLESPLVSGDFSFLRALEEMALPLENKVYDYLVQLQLEGDAPTQIFVEDFLLEQAKALGELNSLLTKARRLNGDPVALHLLDKEVGEMGA